MQFKSIITAALVGWIALNGDLRADGTGGKKISPPANHEVGARPKARQEGEGIKRPVELSDLITKYKEFPEQYIPFLQESGTDLSASKSPLLKGLGSTLKLEAARIPKELEKIKKIDPNVLDEKVSEEKKKEVAADLIRLSETGLFMLFTREVERIQNAIDEGRAPKSSPTDIKQIAAENLAKKLSPRIKGKSVLFQKEIWKVAFPNEDSDQPSSHFGKMVHAFGPVTEEALLNDKKAMDDRDKEMTIIFGQIQLERMKLRMEELEKNKAAK